MTDKEKAEYLTSIMVDVYRMLVDYCRKTGDDINDTAIIVTEGIGHLVDIKGGDL